MPKQSSTQAVDFDFIDLGVEVVDSQREILSGLLATPKKIHPKYFYDNLGSKLFEKITRQPEYYPTTTEVGIFKDSVAEIADICGTDCVIVEPGSGNSEKIRYLLDSMKPRQYVPIDISGEFLTEAAANLAREFSWLDILAVNADFHAIKRLPDSIRTGAKLVFYPGSTIGNMQPEEAVAFLKRIRGWLTESDRGLLIGIDLHKGQELLEPAYNDNRGVTAEFNKNILENVNAIAGANFNKEAFEHRAIYNQDHKRIEMYLDTKEEHEVTLRDKTIQFEAGESILTEYSYKYTLEDIEKLAEEAGFILQKTWLDEDSLFSVSFLRVSV